MLRWAKFFAANSAAELEQLVMTYPDLQDTKEALDRLAMDRTAQHLIEDRERALADQERLMDQIAMKSEAKGRAEGEAAALRRVIERLCDAATITLTQKRQDQLRSASLPELERISESLMARRAWPGD